MSDSVRPHRWQPTRLCLPRDSPGKNTGVGCNYYTIFHKVNVNTNEIHGKTEAHSRKRELFKKKQIKILELKNIIPELNNSLDRLDNIMELLEVFVYSQINQYKLPNLSKLPKNKGEKEKI